MPILLVKKDRDLSRSSFLPIRVVFLAPPLVGALPEVGTRLVGQAGEHKFCRTYENVPELTRLAMKIGWTQNIVILEACKTTKERAWYFVSVLEHNWTKTELLRKIQNEIWLNSGLDEVWDSCYTKENIMILEHQKNDKDSFHQSPEYMPKSSGRIYHEEIGTKSWTGGTNSNRFGSDQSRGDWMPRRFTNSSAPK